MQKQFLKPALWLAMLTLSAGVIVHTQDDPRASALLQQARKTLGGEGRFNSVRSLSLAGTWRRIVGVQQVSSDLEIHFQLPDKFLRRETMESPNGSSTVIETGFNGAEQLGNADASSLNLQRGEFARLLAGLLFTASPSFPVSFTYVSDATTSSDTADILDAHGPDGFAFRLFLDKQTHRPTLLSYFTESVVKEPASSRRAEVRMLFDGYQPVGGIQLPHLLSRSVDGGPFEDWEIETFTINPRLAPATFQKK